VCVCVCVCVISENITECSVALVEGKEWSVSSVSRCMRDVAVDSACSFTVILCWNN